MPSLRTVLTPVSGTCRHMLPLIALIMVMATAQAFHHHTDLAYIRSDITGGALWRLLSAHLVHHNAAHLLLNATALTAIWFIGHQEYPGLRFIWLSCSVATLTGCLLYLCEPQLAYYLGFSGALHGILAAIALRMVVHRFPPGYLLGAALLLKLAWEYAANDAYASTAALIGLRVATEAHFWGTVSGLLIVSPLITQTLFRQLK